MPLSVEVIETIDCAGEPHRVQATSDGLRLLDHEEERRRVFDVLAGASGCQNIRTSWDRLLHRFEDPNLDNEHSLRYIEVFIPNPESPSQYDERQRQTLMASAKIAAHAYSALAQPDCDPEEAVEMRSLLAAAQDTGPLLGLPPNLRTSLALQYVERALDAGVVSDRARAQRLRAAVADCWRSFAAAGALEPAAHRALMSSLRQGRWRRR